MATRVASILAEIGIDSSKFTGGANDILGGLSKMIGGFDASALAAGGLVAALGTLIAAEREFAAAAAESAMAQAKVDAVMKATGGSVGLTTKELQKFATELSRSAGIDDELVQSAEAIAMTFTHLHGDVFKKTITAAADISAIFGGDLVSNTQKLGRALETFDGFTALSRQIGKFTPEQEAQIKKFQETNDLIGYQNYLLDLLEGKVGGAANAMNGASDGSAAFNIELENLKENIGSLLLPEVREFTANMTKMLVVINDNWEAVANLIGILLDLRRAMLAVLSLGMSELFRWLFRGDWQPAKPPPYVRPQGGATPEAGGLGFMTPRPNNQPAPQSQGAPAGGLSVGNIYIGDTSNMTREQVTGMMQQAFAGAMSK